MINNTKLFSMLLNIRLIRSFSHKGKHRIRPTRQQIRKHVNQENLVLLRHKAANMPYQECVIGNTEFFAYLLTNCRIKTEFIQLNGARNYSKIMVFAKQPFTRIMSARKPYCRVHICERPQYKLHRILRKLAFAHG